MEPKGLGINTSCFRQLEGEPDKRAGCRSKRHGTERVCRAGLATFLQSLAGQPGKLLALVGSGLVPKGIRGGIEASRQVGKESEPDKRAGFAC